MHSSRARPKKKFDDDFDILVSNAIRLDVGNKTLSNLLTSGSDISATELQRLLQLNESLNIALPINIEKWDIATQAPLVTFIPSNYKENETPYFVAYDFRGEQYLIDAIKEPTVPVIVVGRNERMGYLPKKSNHKNLRTSGNYERIEYIKCPNLSSIEGWANGAPEIRFEGILYSVTGGAAISACSNIENVPSRSHAKNGYNLAAWNGTQNLFIWLFDSSHGPNYYLQTFEVDNSGNSTTMSVGVSYQGATSNYSITYKEDDKKLKGELINSTHPSPATIADSNIQFRLEN